MKGKSNYLLQFSLIFSMLCLILFPFVLIMMIISTEEIKLIDYFKFIILYINSPILIFIFRSIINFIIVILFKPKVYFYENEFYYKNEMYKYDDIIELEFDFGEFGRISGKSHSLVLYREGQPGIIITNPSLAMILFFRRKCFNKKIYLENLKELLMIGVIVLIVSIVYLITIILKK